MRGISWLAPKPVSFSRRTLLHGVVIITIIIILCLVVCIRFFWGGGETPLLHRRWSNVPKIAANGSLVAPILNMDIKWRNWSASCFDRFTAGKRVLGSPWLVGWVGIQNRYGRFREKNKISRPCRDSNYASCDYELGAQHHTDWATPTAPRGRAAFCKVNTKSESRYFCPCAL